MFTGIIEGIGEIGSIQKIGSDATCIIKVPALFSDCRKGDSIAVDGVCLTIASIRGDVFTLDISSETLGRTTLGGMKYGEKVNLERALRLSDRLGGHFVSGHVDSTGTIERSEKSRRSLIIQIGIDKEISRYLIEKGSIAVNGISLTINRCTEVNFEVTIIPETANQTTISRKKVGDMVNIETDMISKYIEKFSFNNKLSISEKKDSSIDKAMLSRYGFGDGNGNF